MVTVLESIKPILEENFISIVIPVFNEQENVIQLFDSIKETMENLEQKFEIIFVDDGSRDNTLANLKLLLEEHKEEKILRIIQLQRNFGQTPALLAGLHNALGNIVITLDGDLQNDPKDIPLMLSALTNDNDVICGWRKNRHDNLFKKLPSKINNYLNRKLNKVMIHDSGCTFRAYRRETIQNLQLFAEGHRYIPAILANQGFQIGEIETTHHPRTHGKSKYGIKRLFRGFIDLFTSHWLNKWQNKPIHFFVRWVIVFAALGFGFFTWSIAERFLFHLFWSRYSEPILLINNPLFIVSILFCLFSFQTLFFGFLAEIFVRRTSEKDQTYQIKREWR